jgi:phosphoribosylformylglycinamidine synthase subunit PurSL
MPVPGERQGLVISNGLSPQLSQYDGWLMALCAADEAVRNAVCVGADPDSLTLLDNFCWTDPVPGPRNPEAEAKLAILVRACMGLADLCRTYGAPLISGKDSMKNDFDDGVVRLSVPPTLLISAMGKIADAGKAISMEFKRPGDLIYLVTAGTPSLAASTAQEVADGLRFKSEDETYMPSLDLKAAARMYRAIHKLISDGLVHSAHDLSEGGLLVALSESVLSSAGGAEIRLEGGLVAASNGQGSTLFGEGPARIILSIPPAAAAVLEAAIMPIEGARLFEIGVVTDRPEMSVEVEGETGPKGDKFSFTTGELRSAWTSALPFD